MTTDSNPLISVVIPTIDSGAAITRTVDSVLANDYPNREIIVADQSENDDTGRCLQPLVEAGRIRYLRVPRGGVALNRNRGAREARGAVIACTDDDCVVPRSWLAEIARVFNSDQRIGMMFGNVLAGEHDRESGFVQAYVRSEPFLATGAGEKHIVEGIGACMAFRRSVWDEIGGFDLALGAGSDFRSAEETDFAFRVLLAGYSVYETPAVSVVHHGFRSWDDRPRILRDYLYGLGAMSAKHLACGHWKILNLMSHLAFRWAFAGPVADLGGRPPRLLRLTAYLRGLAAGAAAKPDRGRGLYRADGGGLV